MRPSVLSAPASLAAEGMAPHRPRAKAEAGRRNSSHWGYLHFFLDLIESLLLDRTNIIVFTGEFAVKFDLKINKIAIIM